MKFQVEENVFEKLRDMCIGVVYAEGIDNRMQSEKINEILAKSIKSCVKETEGRTVKNMEEISCYRDAFRTLGMNPNKFMCSIEALMTRAAKKGDLPSINPVVDLVNSMSLKHHVAIGAHDASTFAPEGLMIRYSREDDSFVAFNSDEYEDVDIGELVYVSGHEIRTRRWIWRQSEKGKIQPASKDILFPVDGFPQNEQSVKAAAKELAELIEELFRCEVRMGWIDSRNRIFTL